MNQLLISASFCSSSREMHPVNNPQNTLYLPFKESLGVANSYTQRDAFPFLLCLNLLGQKSWKQVRNSWRNYKQPLHNKRCTEQEILGAESEDLKNEHLLIGTRKVQGRNFNSVIHLSQKTLYIEILKPLLVHFKKKIDYRVRAKSSMLSNGEYKPWAQS